MTKIITPQQAAIQQYLAGLNQTTYTYPFLILLPTDLNVYVTAPNTLANPVADLVPDSDYTLTGVGVITGGQVIFNTAPAQGSVVTVARNMQLAITTQFNDAQNFNGQSLDNAFQRIVLLLQQMQGNFTINAGMTGSISRCLQYVVDTYLPNQANSILPLLTVNAMGVQTDNQVWTSQGGNIVVAPLEENPNSSALRGQLASQIDGADGGNIVGYYDQNSNSPGTLTQYLNTSNIYGVDTGSVNAIAFSAPVLSKFTDYVKGMIVRVLMANTNNGNTTITISPAGAANVFRDLTNNVLPGDLPAGQIVELQYTGTNFQLIGVYPPYYGVDTSVTPNTVTVNVYPALAAYVAGYPKILVKIANTSTGAVVINANGLGSKSVVMPDGSALIGNELYAGMIAEFLFDGTNIQLLNPARVFASNAQTVSATPTNLTLSQSGVASGLSGKALALVTNGSAGHIVLPGGFFIQYGRSGLINSGSNLGVSFPVSFPNACVGFVVTPQVNPGDTTQQSYGATANTTTITIENSGAGNYVFQFIALGY